jgi:hypothetical protein
MLKIFMRMLLALAFCSAAVAQNPRNGNLDVLGYFNMTGGTWSAPFVPVSTDPTGACSHLYQIVMNSTTGQMTACIGSTWTTLGGGGGGGALSGLTTGALQLANSSTTLGASALSDNGTAISSSEPMNISSGGISAIIIGSPHTPASSSEACTAGTIVWDSSFVYVCVSSAVWKRSALSSF